MLEVSFERGPGASCFAALALAPATLFRAFGALRAIQPITGRVIQLHSNLNPPMTIGKWRMENAFACSVTIQTEAAEDVAPPASLLPPARLLLRRYLPFTVLMGPAGLGGNTTGDFKRAITSAIPRSSCGSFPSSTDFGSFSTSMSGSTP